MHQRGLYAPTWIKVDLGSTSFETSKLLIKSVQMKYDVIIKGVKMR